MSDLLNVISNRVRYERLMRGWTQAYLADKVGIKPHYISRLENYQHNIPIMIVRKVLINLNVKLIVKFIPIGMTDEERAEQDE